ncbi:hypothetical protein DNTS_002202, partial [Danionella cerebrum]
LTLSGELRCLSPVKEGSSDHTLSPFGSRIRLPINPEERPIRPGLKEEQKTFEEFVEEHLKTEQALLQDGEQALNRGAEKRNFLRKGEGSSRVSKRKVSLHSPCRKHTVSPQVIQNQKEQQCGLHQPNRSSPGGPRHSQMVTSEDLLSYKNVNVNKSNPKLDAGVLKINNRRNGNKLSGFTLGHSNNVAFKKINDHIVKVQENNICPRTENSWHSQRREVSSQNVQTIKRFDSPSLSDSEHSSSSDEGPNSQSHTPFPHLLSVHMDHKDQSLDLSDGDYASDAPSDRFNGDHCSPSSTSSSVFNSDSEAELMSSSLKPEKQRLKSDTREWEPSTEMFPEMTRTPEDLTCSLEQKREEKEGPKKDDCRSLTKIQEGFHDPEGMRQQISFLKKQLEDKESHWWQTHSFLESRVEALTRENQELQSRLGANQQLPCKFRANKELQSLLDAPEEIQSRFQDLQHTPRGNQRAHQGCGFSKPQSGMHSTIYYYFHAKTTHSTYPSGLEVVTFANNQKEKYHPDGTREIFFPNGTVKILHSDSREESLFPDGTVIKRSPNGEKLVEFSNGQKEIHTSQYKRRIYPDGAVKTLYTNGRQEIKFSSGKVRITNNQ